LRQVIREREIKALEFAVIRTDLAELTLTPMGRQMALEMIPAAERSAVERLQKETNEGRLLCARAIFTPQAVGDIEPLALRAQKGGILSGAECAQLALFLKGVTRWRQFMRSYDQRDLYPLLSEMVSHLDGFAGLAGRLQTSIDDEGKVLDEASPLLSDLRRKQRALQERIRGKLDGYLRDPHTSRYLQDPIITIRNGRYVLPVKQEYRRQLNGVLHDQSASGATLFIEPMPVVQLQNQLTALANQAEREIERILSDLSVIVAGIADGLLTDRIIYGELDFVVARGRLSLRLKGCEPRLLNSEKLHLSLVGARHPLLKEGAVPLHVNLDEENRVLIITGPNTGGKTVALKTVGLMCIMAQCGLHLPADGESALSVFEIIRADIGDEQSIAQSLSTFSGHMQNIISVMKELEEFKPASLVLFDEIGAGTDPSEGAALAMSILAELSRSGSLAVATTHLSELKLFAQVEGGMQNAAMEFDPETLSPTYRLLQGVPGQSNALVIAGKLGLDQNLIETARAKLRREHEQIEEIIRSLTEDQRRLQQDSRQASLHQAQAEQVLEQLRQEREKTRTQREEIISAAREEARSLLRLVKHKSDALINELKQIGAAGKDDALARAEQLRRELHSLRRETDLTTGEPETEPLPVSSADLAPGREILVHSLRQKGEIISLSGEEALVQVGSMKVHVPCRDLRRWQGKSEEPDRQSGYVLKNDPGVRGEIDLRGMTVDEAVPAVDKYLSDLAWAGLTRATLIHGKGTGRLKEGLRLYLKEHRQVKSFRGGLPGEGGAGVTVVELGE
jgi:DNA mismatch repair protein MutS2